MGGLGVRVESISIEVDDGEAVYVGKIGKVGVAVSGVAERVLDTDGVAVRVGVSEPLTVTVCVGVGVSAVSEVGEALGVGLSVATWNAPAE